MSDRRRRRVLLLFGGRSAEHDVSRATAVSVATALDPDRYDVIPVGISTDGQWLLAHDAQAMLAAGRDGLPDAFEVAGSPVAAPSEPGRAEIVSLTDATPDPGGVDVVLPLLHGPYGEDGTVQGLLELAGLPYVGAGVLGSAIGMDKVAMKHLFTAAGLAQAKFLVLRDGHDVEEFAASVAAQLGFPCFVKPANMGSSVGVAKALDERQLRAALGVAASFDEWMIVEEAVAGREIEVGILGDDPPEASVAGEIEPGADFYDYADKYENSSASLIVPAPLEDSETAEVRELAIRAFEACRAEAMARVDFFYEPDGRGFLVNELNTIPGFTPISMYPRLWAESGMPYPRLLDRLIELALERHARRASRAGRQR